ncbi:hypothetical protein H9623_10810 [Oerskovia sp. Sa1BUA8]|uniref:Uncharacterized protein n=1 Tax=Oerskovia douganii TaxID=2762210 RepID=A0A9D5UA75_9CELL|nr:hypothetical protein [Oerskovia douganii]MBE7700790.1 hypothetical protein [Oerskovia douganii]
MTLHQDGETDVAVFRGAFASESDALRAVGSVVVPPGGTVDVIPYGLDEVHWTEGFVTEYS